MNCDCTNQEKNFGTNDCPFYLNEITAMLFVRPFTSAGVESEFATRAAVTKLAIQALLDASNAKDRIYPILGIENAQFVQADAALKTFPSGTKIYLNKGQTGFTLEIPANRANGASPQLLEAYKSLFCGQWSAYMGDSNNSMLYVTDADDKEKVKPILLSFINVRSKLAQNGEPYTILIDFDIDRNVDESLYRVLTQAVDLNFNINSRLDIYGLNNVKATYSGITATTVDVLYQVQYSINDTTHTIGLEGFVVGDAGLYNVTTSAAVAVSAAPPHADLTVGKYELTFAAQTTSDVMKGAASKSRFSFYNDETFVAA